MLHSLFGRVPSVWIALAIGGFIAWVYLRTAGKNDRIVSVVKDRVFGVVLVYMLFSKFASGLIYHPSLNLQNDIFSMLGASADNGWPVGLLAAILYLLYGLRKSEAFGQRACVVAVEGVISGSIPFFAFLAVVNLNPFRMEYISRSAGAVLLLVFVLGTGHRTKSYPQRLWAVFGVLLLATSVLVPHLTVWFFISPSQWSYIALIAACIVVEGISDAKGKTGSSGPGVTNNGHVQYHLNENEHALNHMETHHADENNAR